MAGRASSFSVEFSGELGIVSARTSCFAVTRNLLKVFGQYVVGAFPLATDVGLGYASGEVPGRFTCRFDGEKVSGDVNPRAVLVSRTWLRPMAGVWYAARG